MTTPKHISEIELQCARMADACQTIRHHLMAANYSLARVEMGCIVSVIAELNRAIAELENVGRQPEENVTLNPAKNFLDCIFASL